MNEPNISVAMCTYNGGRFLGDQLESIHRQTIPPAEIVIADDGSTDNTLEVIEQFGKRTGWRDRIRLLISGGGPRGPAKNFERALAQTAGDYVTLCDQDDLWAPHRLAAAVEQLKRHPQVWLHSVDARLVNDRGESLGKTQFQDRGMTFRETALLSSSQGIDYLVRGNVLPGMTFTVRRELLRATLPVCDGWMHDYYLAICAAALNRLCVERRADLLAYRQHEGNAIGARRASFLQRARGSIGARAEPSVKAETYLRLMRHWESIDFPVSDQTLAALQGKSNFEQARAVLPTQARRRLPEVRKLAASGQYGRFASSGHLTALRDALLKPSGPRGHAIELPGGNGSPE